MANTVFFHFYSAAARCYQTARKNNAFICGRCPENDSGPAPSFPSRGRALRGPPDPERGPFRGAALARVREMARPAHRGAGGGISQGQVDGGGVGGARVGAFIFLFLMKILIFN